MTLRRSTLVLAGITLVVLVLSVPGTLREALERGEIYLFSRAFLEDIPRRLTGPGRFRFILQPLTAIVLGIRSGLADARAGRPPYLYGVLFHPDLRRQLMTSTLESVANLLLLGILLDAVAQWLILGVSHAGAALVVGPVLIVTPYTVARALANRAARLRTKRAVHATLLLLIVALLMAGCTVGPRTVARDRFDYSAAVADSWKSQMMLNLVRLRYGDIGVFLDVGQIVSGYTVETVVSASAFWNLFGFSIEHPNVPNNTVAASVGGRFTDRPTITYTPLMGERFARSMMTPVPPASVLSLIQAGYPVDLVLRLMVNVVNGLDNRHGGDLRARPAEAEFLELLERLRRVQLSGAIGMRVQRTDTKEVATLLTFRQKVDPGVAADALGIRRLLGVDPAASEFRVVYGAIADDNHEIAMLTRSALEILINLASFIDVPPAHVAEQRVSPMAEPDQGPSGPLRPLLQIKSSRERPADAFVMVPYRDYWFWIDDRDIPSKRMFSFIMFIFTLVEPGSKEAPPVLTIPTG